MGGTVITQRHWRAVMGREPWRYEGLEKNQIGDDFPAVYVSWDDAVLFCEELTGIERKTGRLTASQSYRLPTEAEWEYACRAGTTTAYSFGNDPEQLGKYGWFGGFFGNSDDKMHPVAQKKPNPWGLFDMHGNVWEWCDDWYYPTLGGGDDPVGLCGGEGRVNRGGAGREASFCRSASRGKNDPWFRSVGIGFRVVLR
jgi:formylglycine-generating enzyme required for sulfatase activity